MADHRVSTWSLAVCAVVLTTCFSTAAADDIDRDGIADDVESALLATFAPEFRAGDNGEPCVLLIDWYVRHCRMCWYGCEQTPVGIVFGQIGCTEGATSISEALAIISSHQQAGLHHDYRLGFVEDGFKFGNDPSEPMSWQIAQRQQTGVYGRVSPFVQPNPGNGCSKLGNGGDVLRVQYFMFFGWNETDTPPGCDAGNHEGDVLSVDFDVTVADPASPRILRAYFHNHGRQVFVPVEQLAFTGDTHPKIYLERGSNEPWAWASPVGMTEDTCPPEVTANKVFPPMDILGFLVGGEYGDWTAVREHEGLGPTYLVTNVTNLGERGYAGDDPESVFLQGYYGMMGDYWSTGCTVCVPPPICFDIDFLNTDSPRAPMYNGAVNSTAQCNTVTIGCSKMWDRVFDLPVVRVDNDAVNCGDGNSWGTACNQLQGALNGSEEFRFRDIWVKAGTYKPAPTGGNREATFLMQNCRRIYGGFAGDETVFEHRNVDQNVTILSGDLNGDDGPDFANYGDNSLHVVSATEVDASALLDGFTVTGGNSDVSQAIGGISLTGGGGLLCDLASPRITSCNFLFNTSSGYGGAVLNWRESSTSFEECTFSMNKANYQTGAVANKNWYLREESAPRFVRCEFTDNDGGPGGGAAISNVRANAVLVDCCFAGNHSGGPGGAVWNAGSDTLMVNCDFVDNVADAPGGTFHGGGGVINGGLDGSTLGILRLHNCVFAGNHADYNTAAGGAIHSTAFGILEVHNCTISGNTAWQSNAGGIQVVFGTSEDAATIANSIVYGNSGIVEIGSNVPGVDVMYSNVQGGWPGEGNIDVPPVFVDGTNADLHLAFDSPCISLGSNELIPADSEDVDGDGDITEPIPIDADGNPRIAGGIVDMGAYEFQPDCPGDFDGSGDIGFGDLTQLLLEWGPCPPACPWDVDGSGDVGFGDLTLLLLAWGPC